MAPALAVPVSPVPAATAGDSAFYVIFGIFVVAMLVLVVLVLVWAIRHDVAGRRAWRARHDGGPDPPSASNGAA
jgi:hypothetical protein